MKNKKILLEKTKEALDIVNEGNPDLSIQLLKKIVKQTIQKKQLNPQIRYDCNEILKVAYNNLACAYNKKGKYKSSLYNLELVQSLENQQNYKFNEGDVPLTKIHQLVTNYSNICAVYSKMHQHRKALEKISNAIQLLEGKTDQNSIELLLVCSYNYAIQNQFLCNLNQSYKIVKKSLELFDKQSNNKQIQKLLKDCLERLQQKMQKRQKRIGRYLQQYSNGIGINSINFKKHVSNMNVSNQNHSQILINSKKYYDLDMRRKLNFQKYLSMNSRSMKINSQYPQFKFPVRNHLEKSYKSQRNKLSTKKRSYNFSKDTQRNQIKLLEI